MFGYKNKASNFGYDNITKEVSETQTIPNDLGDNNSKTSVIQINKNEINKKAQEEIKSYDTIEETDN